MSIAVDPAGPGPVLLVGDIGGTNTRLAFATLAADGFRLDALSRHATPEDLPALLSRQLDGRKVDIVALCGAGPLRDDGSLKLSNNPCLLDPAAIAKATGARQVIIVNDFEAIAQAVPALQPADLREIQTGVGHASAARLIIGPGTGLGVASLIAHDGDWLVLPGEGGHVDLAPVDDAEVEVFLKLRARHGPLCVESLLSGSGFAKLHAALSGGPMLEPPDIVVAARSGDAVAAQAMQMFARWLGRVAGNAALTTGARGGVWIAGGIVPAWGADFDRAAFRDGFCAKRGFEQWLAAIPVQLIIHPQPGLIGLARLGAAAISTNFAGHKHIHGVMP
ncbi:MAG: ROK family protein [Nevskia sp.]|nr:ROK family protein [Nevskia sp.]